MADDPELEAIRQRRMQQLLAQQGGQGGPPGGRNLTPEQQEEQEAAKRDAEEQRQNMLRQVMQAQAKERLSRIALVKPEKARQVENMILMQARSGRLTDKISESQLIQLLEQINEKTSSTTKVTFQRRRNILDDDD
ncbi:hypothetical protein BSKO_04575 [Bryopsis sp. KO-2023]|nr:hypothetical protein BSKO_04575 [Bryopsis sp. KO-2023]